MKEYLSKEKLERLVKESKTYSEIVRKLKLTLCSGNHRTIKNYIKKFDIDDSHLLGQAWRKGLPRPEYLIHDIPLEDLLKEGTIVYSGFKNRLIKAGYFESKCYSCHLKEWLGKTIPVQLHHINGDKYDNRIENLTLLCPNCHTFTPNYGGKNIRYKKENRSISKEELVELYKTMSLLDIHKEKNIPFKLLCKLKKEYNIKTNIKRVVEMSRIEKRKFNPSKEELEKLVNTMPTTKVSKIFGVSDKAIDKRCKLLGISKPGRGFWSKKQKIAVVGEW